MDQFYKSINSFVSSSKEDHHRICPLPRGLNTLDISIKLPYQPFYTYRAGSRAATFYQSRSDRVETVDAVNTMPSFPRRVVFDPTETVSRPADEDELQALYNYTRHASHCDRCADPYRVHLAGKTLCDRGHQHAREVAKYIHLDGGRPCSTMDTHERHYVEVEIPIRYDVVRSLLKALDRGLQLRRPKSSSKPAKAVITYDRVLVDRPRRAEPRSKSKPSRAIVEIVEPPRRKQQADRRLIYINRDGSLHRPSIVDHDYDDDDDDDDESNMVVYASPRSTSRYHAQEEFYR